MNRLAAVRARRIPPPFLGLALALVGLAGTAAGAPPEAEGQVIEYASPQAALAALRAKPGVTEREENDWNVLQVAEAGTVAIWSIATPRHPAYPTAVKRVLFEDGGSVHSKLSVMCGASKAICDRVAEQFQENDSKLQERYKAASDRN